MRHGHAGQETGRDERSVGAERQICFFFASCYDALLKDSRQGGSTLVDCSPRVSVTGRQSPSSEVYP